MIALPAIIAIVVAVGVLLLLLTIKFRRMFHQRTTTRVHIKPPDQEVVSSTMSGNLVVEKTDVPISSIYHLKSSKLGRGSSAEVVIGVHIKTRRKYAIKVIDTTRHDARRLHERYEREKNILRDIDHTNIIRLFEVYCGDVAQYFVMELCTGGHLGQVLARQPEGRLDVEVAKQYIIQLTRAVAHLHSVRICHRDIKLQNILLESASDGAQIKLIDFGNSWRFKKGKYMTKIVGTTYTAAPEVLRECYDERCDVWSVGVVSYILLSGRRPFESIDIPGQPRSRESSLIAAILMGRYHFHHEAWEEVPPIAIHFVKWCLEMDFKKRKPSAELLMHPWIGRTDLHSALGVGISRQQANVLHRRLSQNRQNSGLRRTSMVAVAFTMPADKLQTMREMFQKIDKDGTGTLERDEFQEAMLTVDPTMSPEDVQLLFDSMDIDGDKHISFLEFVAATIDPREVDIQEVNQAFRLLDKDGKGFISKTDLQRVLGTATADDRELESQDKALLKMQEKAAAAAAGSTGRVGSGASVLSMRSNSGAAAPARSNSGAAVPGSRGSGSSGGGGGALSPTSAGGAAGAPVIASLASVAAGNSSVKSVQGGSTSSFFTAPTMQPNDSGSSREGSLDSNSNAAHAAEAMSQLGPRGRQQHRKMKLNDRIQHIIEQADVDNDGVISYAEFLLAMAGSAETVGREAMSGSGGAGGGDIHNKLMMSSKRPSATSHSRQSSGIAVVGGSNGQRSSSGAAARADSGDYGGRGSDRGSGVLSADTGTRSNSACAPADGNVMHYTRNSTSPSVFSDAVAQAAGVGYLSSNAPSTPTGGLMLAPTEHVGGMADVGGGAQMNSLVHERLGSGSSVDSCGVPGALVVSNQHSHSPTAASANAAPSTSSYNNSSHTHSSSTNNGGGVDTFGGESKNPNRRRQSDGTLRQFRPQYSSGGRTVTDNLNFAKINEEEDKFADSMTSDAGPGNGSTNTSALGWGDVALLLGLPDFPASVSSLVSYVRSTIPRGFLPDSMARWYAARHAAAIADKRMEAGRSTMSPRFSAGAGAGGAGVGGSEQKKRTNSDSVGGGDEVRFRRHGVEGEGDDERSDDSGSSSNSDSNSDSESDYSARVAVPQKRNSNAKKSEIDKVAAVKIKPKPTNTPAAGKRETGLGSLHNTPPSAKKPTGGSGVSSPAPMLNSKNKSLTSPASFWVNFVPPKRSAGSAGADGSKAGPGSGATRTGVGAGSGTAGGGEVGGGLMEGMTKTTRGNSMSAFMAAGAESDSSSGGSDNDSDRDSDASGGGGGGGKSGGSGSGSGIGGAAAGLLQAKQQMLALSALPASSSAASSFGRVMPFGDGAADVGNLSDMERGDSGRKGGGGSGRIGIGGGGGGGGGGSGNHSDLSITSAGMLSGVVAAVSAVTTTVFAGGVSEKRASKVAESSPSRKEATHAQVAGACLDGDSGGADGVMEFSPSGCDSSDQEFPNVTAARSGRSHGDIVSAFISSAKHIDSATTSFDSSALPLLASPSEPQHKRFRGRRRKGRRGKGGENSNGSTSQIRVRSNSSEDDEEEEEVEVEDYEGGSRGSSRSSTSSSGSEDDRSPRANGEVGSSSHSGALAEEKFAMDRDLSGGNASLSFSVRLDSGGAGLIPGDGNVGAVRASSNGSSIRIGFGGSGKIPTAESPFQELEGSGHYTPQNSRGAPGSWNGGGVRGHCTPNGRPSLLSALSRSALQESSEDDTAQHQHQQTRDPEGGASTADDVGEFVPPRGEDGDGDGDGDGNGKGGGGGEGGAQRAPDAPRSAENSHRCSRVALQKDDSIRMTVFANAEETALSSLAEGGEVAATLSVDRRVSKPRGSLTDALFSNSSFATGGDSRPLSGNAALQSAPVVVNPHTRKARHSSEGVTPLSGALITTTAPQGSSKDPSVINPHTRASAREPHVTSLAGALITSPSPRHQLAAAGEHSRPTSGRSFASGSSKGTAAAAGGPVLINPHTRSSSAANNAPEHITQLVYSPPSTDNNHAGRPTSGPSRMNDTRPAPKVVNPHTRPSGSGAAPEHITQLIYTPASAAIDNRSRPTSGRSVGSTGSAKPSPPVINPHTRPTANNAEHRTQLVYTPAPASTVPPDNRGRPTSGKSVGSTGTASAKPTPSVVNPHTRATTNNAEHITELRYSPVPPTDARTRPISGRVNGSSNAAPQVINPHTRPRASSPGGGIGEHLTQLKLSPAVDNGANPRPTSGHSNVSGGSRGSGGKPQAKQPLSGNPPALVVNPHTRPRRRDSSPRAISDSNTSLHLSASTQSPMQQEGDSGAGAALGGRFFPTPRESNASSGGGGPGAQNTVGSEGADSCNTHGSSQSAPNGSSSLSASGQGKAATPSPSVFGGRSVKDIVLSAGELLGIVGNEGGATDRRGSVGSGSNGGRYAVAEGGLGYDAERFDGFTDLTQSGGGGGGGQESMSMGSNNGSNAASIVELCRMQVKKNLLSTGAEGGAAGGNYDADDFSAV